MTEETVVETPRSTGIESKDRRAAREWDSLRQRTQDGSLDIARNVWGNPDERGSTNFQYRDAHLDICWVTNVPNTLDEGLAYFVQLVEWGLSPVFIEMKDIGEDKFSLQPFEFDPETLVLKNFKTEETWSYKDDPDQQSPGEQERGST